MAKTAAAPILWDVNNPQIGVNYKLPKIEGLLSISLIKEGRKGEERKYSLSSNEEKKCKRSFRTGKLMGITESHFVFWGNKIDKSTQKPKKGNKYEFYIEKPKAEEKNSKKSIKKGIEVK
ncbi:MAG: hypothetical protein WA101_00880 [Minisyncoccia bacterium]